MSGPASNNQRLPLPRFQLFSNLPAFAKANTSGYQPRPQANPTILCTAEPNTVSSGTSTSAPATTTSTSATKGETATETTQKGTTPSTNPEPAASIASKPNDKAAEGDDTDKKASKTPDKDESVKSNEPKAESTASPNESFALTSKLALEPMASKKIEGEKQPKFSIIHLDPWIRGLPDYYEKLLGENTLPNYFQADTAACLKFIKDDCKEDRIFLLSSGGFGRQIVPEIHALPQLHAVYILCEDVIGHRQWAKDYNKVRVVGFDERRDRFSHFAIDFARTYEDFGDYQMAKGKKDMAKKRYEKARSILGQTGVYNEKFESGLKTKIAASS